MISINGKTYSGDNITINNNQVIIDGKNVTPNESQITIVVNGNLNTLKVDVVENITVNGECGNVDVVNGDVNCGNVKTGVKTVNGNIEAGYVEGGITTVNGNVKAEVIHGDCTSTNGNIRKG